MNIVFLIALIVYLLIFVVIGILDWKKVRNFTDYTVAGRNQNLFSVVMTLLATVMGASTTIGLTDTVNQIGFPGIWWLLFGGVGLVAQSFIIAKKVRGIGVDTLPDLARKTVGGSAEIVLAVIIVLSWIGVIAGQLVAMNSLISFVLGNDSWILFVIVSMIVIGYTLTGGQMSVVKTDRIQFLIIVAGIAACCFYLYVFRGEGNGEIMSNVELLNENYRATNLLTQLFVIGGVYFLGPDIMSRNFIAKNERTARRSSLIAGISLFGLALIVTMIGMWVRFNVTPEELGSSKALMYVIGILPKPIGIVLVFGLLSAILSSTDTCIINASSIFVKDILKRNSVVLVRITVAAIGILSMAFALIGNGDIISLLSGAYSIYTPGVIFPLLIAILAYRKKGIRKGVWLAAVISGGLFGLAGTYFGDLLSFWGIPAELLSNFPLIGMGVSLAVGLASVRWTGSMSGRGSLQAGH